MYNIANIKKKKIPSAPQNIVRVDLVNETKKKKK